MESAPAVKIQRHEVWAAAVLAAFPFVYFWQATLAQNVWFTTDVVRLFHPFGVELARALNEGRLPLWTPNTLAGFPLLAEGQVGALYPLNLILYKFLPAHYAVAYSILLHLAWASVGTYVCARAFGLRPASAWLAGFGFAFSGVIFGHLSHPSVIATIAWLPWLIVLQDRVLRAPTQRARWFVLTTFAVALQFLPGSAQLAFLNALTVVAFGVATWVFERRADWRALITGVLAPLVLGAGIAAAQLAPTLELIGYSVRGETSAEFFTSYSLPLNFLAQVIAPFAQGEPAEATGEYWFYFGVAPLVLALIAPFARRNRRTLFLAAFALGALTLALGGQNPVYGWLYRLPVFGFFRVPARYLFVFDFAAALLAATALDALAENIGAADCSARKPTSILVASFFGVAAVGVIVLVATQPLEFWLSAWQALPLILFALTILGLGLRAARKISGATFAALIVGATVCDLAGFGAPFLATIDALTPAAYVASVPRSVAALDPAQMTGRVYTDLSVFPSLPALRGSFFPASGLAFNAPSAQAYSSLEYARHQAYFANLTANALNALNVQYWMTPLEPRPRTKTATPPASIALDLLNDEIAFAPVEARALVIVSATEQAANLGDGAPVAELVVRFADGTRATSALRVGIETADWDYDRKRATDAIQHSRAPVAHTFPAYWRSFGKAFEGRTYRARFEFAAPRPVVGVAITVLQADARLIVESIALENNERTTTLAHLAGKNDFRLAYFSDTVAAWENLDVLPRAFIAHTATPLDDGAALARIATPEFEPAREVLLATGDAWRAPAGAHATAAITEARAERVVVAATTDQPGYLVLADAWYPGWEARVDDQPVPIARADVLFRAVRLEPGTHTVAFDYRPSAFWLGVAISVASVGLTLGLAWLWRGKTE